MSNLVCMEEQFLSIPRRHLISPFINTSSCTFIFDVFFELDHNRFFFLIIKEGIIHLLNNMIVQMFLAISSLFTIHIKIVIVNHNFPFNIGIYDFNFCFSSVNTIQIRKYHIIVFFTFAIS